MTDEVKRECDALSRLRHPNVVHFWGVAVSERNVFVVMELCEGGSLSDMLFGEDRFCTDAAQLLSIAYQIALALQMLHAHGIIHRDLKPSNVLLDADMNARLCDFGLSRKLTDAGSAMQTMTRCVGTPAFMAPELLAMDGPGRYNGPAVDVYRYVHLHRQSVHTHMSMLSWISCEFTNACAWSHTHTHTLSLLHTHPLTLTHTHTHTLTLTHTHTHTQFWHYALEYVGTEASV